MPIHPKVAASTAGSAVGVLVAYALAYIPGYTDLDQPLREAIVIVVIAAGTFAGGWLKKALPDPTALAPLWGKLDAVLETVAATQQTAEDTNAKVSTANRAATNGRTAAKKTPAK